MGRRLHADAPSPVRGHASSKTRTAGGGAGQGESGRSDSPGTSALGLQVAAPASHTGGAGTIGRRGRAGWARGVWWVDASGRTVSRPPHPRASIGASIGDRSRRAANAYTSCGWLLLLLRRRRRPCPCQHSTERAHCSRARPRPRRSEWQAGKLRRSGFSLVCWHKGQELGKLCLQHSASRGHKGSRVRVGRCTAGITHMQRRPVQGAST